MAIERTFSMLKPGVLSRRIAGEILQRIERKGFDIIALKLMRVSREMAEINYEDRKSVV